jgi:hypothetical protein
MIHRVLFVIAAVLAVLLLVIVHIEAPTVGRLTNLEFVLHYWYLLVPFGMAVFAYALTKR